MNIPYLQKVLFQEYVVGCGNNLYESQYRNAKRTITITFLDIFYTICTANFPQYQFSSTIRRKTELSLTCEEDIGPVVIDPMATLSAPFQMANTVTSRKWDT